MDIDFKLIEKPTVTKYIMVNKRKSGNKPASIQISLVSLTFAIVCPINRVKIMKKHEIRILCEDGFCTNLCKRTMAMPLTCYSRCFNVLDFTCDMIECTC